MTTTDAVKAGRGKFALVRSGASEAMGHVPQIADDVRLRAGQVAQQLPGTARRAQSGAESTITRLQTMSDSTLSLLAAVSIGFGAGPRLAGAPRLATLAGFAPASIFGFAMASRLNQTGPAPRPARS